MRSDSGAGRLEDDEVEMKSRESTSWTNLEQRNSTRLDKVCGHRNFPTLTMIRFVLKW